MFVEAFIFGCYQCVYQMFGNLAIWDYYSVFFVQIVGSQNLSIRGIHLGSKTIYRVLQIFYRGHVAYPTVPYGGES